MMDQVTALLTHSAATIPVVIGWVSILGFTESCAYRAGYCAAQICTDG